MIRTIVLALDLGGTFVFALSGAAVGIRHKLDLFRRARTLVRGSYRGRHHARRAARRDPAGGNPRLRYLAVSVLAGLVTFSSYPIRDRYQIEDRLRKPILVFDAAGLALFAVAGALKALAFQLRPVEAVLIGVLTAVGGGVVRDVLVREVPIVLHSELYAVAAHVGAGLVVGGRMLGFPSDATVVAGAAVCFGLRHIAVRRG